MEGTFYTDKLAKILRVPKSTLAGLITALERATGEVGIMEALFFENEAKIGEKLASLGVSHEASAQEVYDALVSKVEADDVELLKLVGHESLRSGAASEAVVEFVKKAYHGTRKGFFMKRDKARELLTNEPPKGIMRALGYASVGDLLKEEDLDEVMSALRFLEDEEWQNTVFFKQYESLTSSDFEEREVEMRVLGEKWARVAEAFVAKKYHNVSHLKEMGVIFVIPIFLGISGETLRLTSLLLHYSYEVAFYADVFRIFAKDKLSFSRNLISALRGDVIERRLPDALPEVARPRFLVVQRYLAKLDENDWRLAEPRVNPEALHWSRAEEDVAKLDGKDMRFWSDMGWVGDLFKTDLGDEAFMSFNLGDVVMTLVKRKEVRYLYHAQEAMWNRIFSAYFGVEALERLSKENLVRGWFEI